MSKMFIQVIILSIFLLSSNGRTISKQSKCNKELSSGSLTNLTLFTNNRTGIGLDHYLTTFSPEDKEMEGYNAEKVLGKVLLDPSGCDCSVRLIQMYDNGTAILGSRNDHKLVRDGEEADRFGENYQEGDEVFYCAQKKGGCGASVPLYKEWNVASFDSSYSTNDIPTIFMERYPTKPLCYLWPLTAPITSTPSFLQTH